MSKWNMSGNQCWGLLFRTVKKKEQYETFRRDKSIESESRWVVSRDWKKGEMESDYKWRFNLEEWKCFEIR